MGVLHTSPIPEKPGVLFPEIASAEDKFRACIQCGVRSASCPMGRLMDYPPRKAVRMLLEGRFDEVVASNTPWLCVSCHTCSTRCPSQLKITDGLFPALRAAVIASGKQLDQDLQKALQNAYLYGNPMAGSPNKRADWAKTSGDPGPHHFSVAPARGRPLDRRVLPLVPTPWPGYLPFPRAHSLQAGS